MGSSESAAQDRGSPRSSHVTAEPRGLSTGRTGDVSASAGSESHGTSAAKSPVAGEPGGGATSPGSSAASPSRGESAEARCIRLMDCSLTETPHGWLAVSTPGSLIRIGVMGATANEALRGFRASGTEWARLHDMPVAPMAGLREL